VAAEAAEMIRHATSELARSQAEAARGHDVPVGPSVQRPAWR
jgi:hypothetical protein